jgi:ribose transport system ATP-binding protein
MGARTMLEMENITKEFPGVLALDGVDFHLRAGEVHALVGENGAGKSTLSKIMAGIYREFSGVMLFEGQEVRLASVEHAKKLGIEIIHQELNLLPNLTVADNIFLGREPIRPGTPFIDQQELINASTEVLHSLGVDFDPLSLVRRLAVSERQIVEIAKALSAEIKVLIMDEPTASLTARETDILFDVIRSLTNQGVGIVYISHKLEEIMTIADRITVLRDGRRMCTCSPNEIDINELVELMVGRQLEQKYIKEKADIGNVVLEAKGLTRLPFISDISFQLRRGEILGFAGLVGAGRTEMARVLFGADSKDYGDIFIDGEKVFIDSPLDAIRHGVMLVPEGRKEEGLVLPLTVEDNIVLPSLRELSRGGLIMYDSCRKLVDDFILSMDIKTPGPRQQVRYLSGGNQQKVVLAKWLAKNPRILIMDEPTRGIDVGAKTEVYAWMSQIAKQGVGIILISSEMPEIIAMSDRIIVMCEGEITGEFTREEATQTKIGHCAMKQGRGEKVV